MAPAEDGDQDIVHHGILADDDLSDLGPQAAVDAAEPFNGLDVIGG
jgi:hypothetical protein